VHAQDIGPELLVAERVESEDLLAVQRFRAGRLLNRQRLESRDVVEIR
jgi:hypothetical protein